MGKEDNFKVIMNLHNIQRYLGQLNVILKYFYFSPRDSEYVRERLLLRNPICCFLFLKGILFLISSWETGKSSSVQFSSITQSCLTLCDPMNHSTPGLPVHHQLPEFTQTHVHT